MNAIEIKPGDTLSTSQLQLADRIFRLYTDYETGAQMADVNLGVITVQNITADEVTLFRPYTHTADFSSTGGVICYVGIEEWKDEIRRDSLWRLISRTTLR